MPRASRHDFHRRVSLHRVSCRHVSGRCASGAVTLAGLALGSGCGGGGGGGSAPPPPPFTSVTQVRVSQPAVKVADCDTRTCVTEVNGGGGDRNALHRAAGRAYAR